MPRGYALNGAGVVMAHTGGHKIREGEGRAFILMCREDQGCNVVASVCGWQARPHGAGPLRPRVRQAAVTGNVPNFRQSLRGAKRHPHTGGCAQFPAVSPSPVVGSGESPEMGERRPWSISRGG
jgi:hypothetical protein